MKYAEYEIVYIEYQDNKPFAVYTAKLGKWGLMNYDFEPDCNENELFIHFNSGSGGLATEIHAPTYVDSCEKSCSYWLHPQAAFSNKPKNITRINEPIEINGSINPFDNSREVHSTIYCKHCDKYLDEDWCDHLTTDDNGDVVYMDGEQHDS